MTILQPIFVALLFFGNPQVDRDNAKPIASMYANAKLAILQENSSPQIKVEEGDKLVFSIDNISLGKVYFQVPGYRRFFRYTDSDMDKVDLVIVKNNQLIRPDSGEINGFKIADGIWKVDLHIKSKENSYQVSYRFYEESLLANQSE